MAASIVALVAGGPALFGTTEAIRQSASKQRRDEHKARRCNLVVRCSKSSQYSPLLEGRRVVLSGSKLYIDTGTDHLVAFGHPFAGYFLPYPDTKHDGLVTSIADEPPIMNWIYVDKDTYEMKYGFRVEAQPHYTGPFNATPQDRRLMYAGWEGFVAVLEDSGFWSLYVDRDDEMMEGKLGEGRVVIEVELFRMEVRIRKPKLVVKEKTMLCEKNES